jgi:hypothetical protein
MFRPLLLGHYQVRQFCQYGAGMFIEVAWRLVIFGEFEIDISKVFRHFRLPLIWIFV